MSKITKKPDVSAGQINSFIAGAPDSTAKAAAPAARPADPVIEGGGRKKPISLTIDATILAQLDRVASGLGISRASAFSLAVSRFIAQENREANQ